MAGLDGFAPLALAGRDVRARRRLRLDDLLCESSGAQGRVVLPVGFAVGWLDGDGPRAVRIGEIAVEEDCDEDTESEDYGEEVVHVLFSCGALCRGGGQLLVPDTGV